MYHSLGREGMQSLREEVGLERAQEWEQAMQARRDAKGAHVAQREAHKRSQYKKAKANWYSLGGTPGWGYIAIANKYGIPLVWVWRLSWDNYQEMLYDPSDDDDDDLGVYDSDRTF